jgi:hypothetical protein
LAFWPEPDGLLDGWVLAAALAGLPALGLAVALTGLPAVALTGLPAAALDGSVPAVRLGDCSSSGEVLPSEEPRVVASWFAVSPKD